MSGFTVLKSGLLTLIEDRGRLGFSHMGITQSGVMDDYAYRCVNALLQNNQECNILEITFAKLKLQAELDTVICVCGANMGLTINEQKASMWQTLTIKKNDLIEFIHLHSGQRAYLGVKGGFNITKEFNSNSTTLRENLGGIHGQKIQEGDLLPYSSYDKKLNNRLLSSLIPTYESHLILRVVLGYQHEYFTQEDKKRFFNQTYTITNEFNRMGCKLNGANITPKRGGIISEGICFGAIQIPKDGQPIILLKERQTIGGYPKIGSVLAIDCYKLSQMKPHMTINFKEISLKEAQEKQRKYLCIFP